MVCLKVKKGFDRGFSNPDIKAENPYKNVKYSGSFENDSRAEFLALFDALNSVKPRDEYKSDIDSRFYIVVIFESKEELEKQMSRFGIARFGYQYADGSKIFNKLKNL